MKAEAEQPASTRHATHRHHDLIAPPVITAVLHVQGILHSAASPPHGIAELPSESKGGGGTCVPYLVGADGKVVFKSGPGPMGSDADAWEAAIRSELRVDAQLPAAPDAPTR